MLTNGGRNLQLQVAGCINRDADKGKNDMTKSRVCDGTQWCGISVFISKIPPLILAIYIIASLLTFIVYAIDKSAAKKGAWRTQESTLHLLSLAGGWPGALVAQQKLRHKSKKQGFRAVFWVTVFMNGGAFVWLLTPTGATILQSLIANTV